MERRRWIAWYRAGFGLLAVATVGFLFVHHRREHPDFSSANFVSYFTIESNLFAAAVLLAGAGRPTGRRLPPPTDPVRGAAVLYLMTAGVVYGVLLAEAAESDRALAWADAVVHRVMPLALVGDWLIDPPRTRLTRRHALAWLAYPLAYVTYSLARGAAVGWYPYPFLNPSGAGGYARVAAYCAGMAAGVLLATWGTVAVGNGRRPAGGPAAGDGAPPVDQRDRRLTKEGF